MHACMHSSNESIQIPSDFETRATTPTPTNRTQKHLTKHQKHKKKNSQQSKVVKFHQNCENQNRDNAGWKVSLGMGSYPRFNGNTCDDDQRLCSIANCKLAPNQLR